MNRGKMKNTWNRNSVHLNVRRQERTCALKRSLIHFPKSKKLYAIAAASLLLLLLLSSEAAIARTFATTSTNCYIYSCDLESPTNTYVGVEGYQTHNSWSHVWEFGTIVSLFGASNVGSDTLYAGFSEHISDGKYAVDYLVQFYAYYTSNGQANLYWAIWAGCAGSPFNCGPAFPGNPREAQTIISGTLSNIGHSSDPVQLYVYWNTYYGWTFDYIDTNNNPYSWTVATYNPSGNFQYMQSTMEFGDESLPYENGPVYYAYFDQVGFLFSEVPQNSNWEMQALNSYYIPSGSSTTTYMNHATTLTWENGATCPPVGSSLCYWSYWKEYWNVGQNPAQIYGATIGGGGDSSENSINVVWDSGNTQPGDVSLW
jgi:hypothetical protein